MIAGPTLDALKWVIDDNELRDLYLNLLATAMDHETAQRAHSAYAEILRQLTPDEARILRAIYEKSLVAPFVVPVIRLNRDGALLGDYSLLGHVCQVPALLDIYMSNLRRIGLTDYRVRVPEAEDTEDYRKLLDDPRVRVHLGTAPHHVPLRLILNHTVTDVDDQTIVSAPDGLALSTFGHELAAACIAPSHSSPDGQAEPIR